SFVFLLPAGHLGASLTYGERWLTGPLDALLHGDKGAGREGTGGAPSGSGAGTNGGTQDGEGAGANGGAGGSGGAPVGAVADYAHVVAPIFAARCGNCHGETRQRSGLDLHTPEGIAKGGKHGVVLV